MSVNGKKYTGAFRYIAPALYLKQDWDYSAAEPPPGDIQSKSDAVVKKQLCAKCSLKANIVIWCNKD